MTGDSAEQDQDKPRGPALFLERESYRRRRLTDAARFLPLLGAALFLLPLLWPVADTAADRTGVSTSRAIVYIFLVWGLLIVVSGVLSARMRTWSQREGPEEREGPEGQDQG